MGYPSSHSKWSVWILFNMEWKSLRKKGMFFSIYSRGPTCNIQPTFPTTSHNFSSKVSWLTSNLIVQALSMSYVSHSVIAFLKIKKFNWSIIALQCCVSFCCTKMWTSYQCTYISSLLSLPPTSPSHPSRSSWCTRLSSLHYTAAPH